jgi:AraC-like DNA-binding protein
LSKYYAATGKAKLSMAYMDSTLAEHQKYEKEFSALQLMRATEKQLLLSEKLQNEQLKVEKVKSKGYKRSLIIAVIGLLLLGIWMVRYRILYHKKRAAYHELVRKSQEWASAPVENYKIKVMDIEIGEDEQMQENEWADAVQTVEQKLQNTIPDETDVLVMGQIEQLMTEGKIYNDPLLTIDSLAQKLKTRQHYISSVINRCTNKNFNTFINEYRVKEAVLLLSREDILNYSIDYVASSSGFKDRINFYRVFKKVTGLSPTDFRKNVR